MAITKERLKELIKQRAEIFGIYEDLFTNACVTSIQLDETCSIIGGHTLEMYDNDGCYHKELYKVFETKEEAEWELEFRNVERIEKLNLPPYQRAVVHLFKDKNNNQYELRMFEYGNISIWTTLPMNLLFNEEANLENYTKACRLAKKLFMGEE